MKLKIKNKKVIISLILILVCGIVGVTFAFFTLNTSFQNNFKASNYSISIEEEFYNDWGTKKVTFINKDSTPVVIRVSYNELWKYSTKEENTISESINLSNKINNQEVVIKSWTEEWNQNFIDGKDGWYYYNKVLDKDSSVQVLTNIMLNEELIKTSPFYQEYQESTYELDFNFESTQADRKAVKNLWGKNINIENNRVSWNINE